MDQQPTLLPARSHTLRKIIFWVVGIIGTLFVLYLVWYVYLLSFSGPHPRTASHYTTTLNIGTQEIVWMNDTSLNADYFSQSAAATQHKPPMYLEVASDGQTELIEQKIIPNDQATCAECGWVVMSNIHSGKISAENAKAFIQQAKLVKNERLGLIPTAHATTIADPIIDIFYAKGSTVQEMLSFYPPSADYILALGRVVNEAFALPILTAPRYAVSSYQASKFDKYDTSHSEIISLTKEGAQKYPSLWLSVGMPGRVAPVVESSEQQYLEDQVSQHRVYDDGTGFGFSMLLNVIGVGKFRVQVTKLAI